MLDSSAIMAVLLDESWSRQGSGTGAGRADEQRQRRRSRGEVHRVRLFPKSWRSNTSKAAISPLSTSTSNIAILAGELRKRASKGYCRSATGPACATRNQARRNCRDGRPHLVRRSISAARSNSSVRTKTCPSSIPRSPPPPTPSAPMRRTCAALVADIPRQGGDRRARRLGRSARAASLARQAAAARAAGAAARFRLALPRDRPVRRLGSCMAATSPRPA